MSRLVAATMLPEPNHRGEVRVELTWETALVALRDWSALSAALLERDIPRQTHTEIRSYASQDLAERAVKALGGTVTA